MQKTLTPFEEKAIDDLAIALVDHQTDRAMLPAQARDVAELVGCTVEQVFCCLHIALTSVMSMKRTVDIFGLPMIDIESARREMKEARKLGALAVELPDGHRIGSVRG